MDGARRFPKQSRLAMSKFLRGIMHETAYHVLCVEKWAPKLACMHKVNNI